MHAADREAHDEAIEFWQKSLRDWRVLTLFVPMSSEYQSRAGATLSNLAVEARKRGEFDKSRALVEEALVYQKRALKTQPVYELAQDFLRTHYSELSLSLTELGDFSALAATAEARVADLPDVPVEYCAAAKSLAECMLQARDAEHVSTAERQRQATHFAQRAMALLEDVNNRFTYDRARFIIAEAYVEVGDTLAAGDFHDDSRKAWESARKLFIHLQDRTDFKGEEEVDDYLKAIEERLGLTTARPREEVKPE
jgi:hypothetical protein